MNDNEKTKNAPLRKCIVCGERKPKKELVRVVRTPDGVIGIDPTGKANGRGAYVCRSGECFGKCRKQHRLEKSFAAPVDESVYDALSAYFVPDVVE